MEGVVSRIALRSWQILHGAQASDFGLGWRGVGFRVSGFGFRV